MVSPETPTEIDLTEKPAHKNWEKLRSLGYHTCQLIGFPETVHGNDFLGEIHDLNWFLAETDLEMLEIEIATYDWYYEMSDDMRVWSDGRAKDARIQGLVDKVGKKYYAELWESYVKLASVKYREPEKFIATFMARLK